MSKKDEELLLVSELRKRIDNLRIIDKPGPFFREIARIAEWMGEVLLFEQPLFALDLQSKKRDKESLQILKEMHFKGKVVWSAIKKIPIGLEKARPEVHQSLRDNLIYCRRNKSYDYLLSGKVYCKCGSKRVGDGVNGHHYYRCAQRIYKYPVQVKCPYEGVNAEILDSMVWNRLLKLFDNPEMIKKQVTRWQSKSKSLSNELQSEADKINKAIQLLSNEEDRYTEAFGSNLINFEKYENLMSGVKAKKSLMQEQINKLPNDNVNGDFDWNDVESVCRRVLDELKLSSVSEKQEYVRKLIHFMLEKGVQRR